MPYIRIPHALERRRPDIHIFIAAKAEYAKLQWSLLKFCAQTLSTPYLIAAHPFDRFDFAVSSSDSQTGSCFDTRFRVGKIDSARRFRGERQASRSLLRNWTCKRRRHDGTLREKSNFAWDSPQKSPQ